MIFTLRDVFGDSPECRIMEVFVDNPECVFSLHAVMELAEVESGKVAFNHIKALLRNGIIYVYGHDGNIEVYKLNTDNTVSKILIMLRATMFSSWMCWLLEDCV